MSRHFSSLSARKSIIKTALIALGLFVGAQGALANEAMPDTGTGKNGKSYVSAAILFNEFRSISIPTDTNDPRDLTLPTFFPESAQTYGISLGYGSFINDYFKVEFRAGTGVIDDTVKRVLDVNLAYWFNWHIGFQHPITDYMAGYAMYGFTVFEADETRREAVETVDTGAFGQTTQAVISPSDDLRSGLFETNFSPSWMLGLEFELSDEWFLGVEYGQLINDSNSNLNVRQLGTHLRYLY